MSEINQTIMEDKEEGSDNSSKVNNKCNCPVPSDSRIQYNHLFYYYIEHPKFQNIYIEVIEGHLILATDHKNDVYLLYIYAIRSPITRDVYMTFEDFL